jgi:hypothetical protein
MCTTRNSLQQAFSLHELHSKLQVVIVKFFAHLKDSDKTQAVYLSA